MNLRDTISWGKSCMWAAPWSVKRVRKLVEYLENSQAACAELEHREAVCLEQLRAYRALVDQSFLEGQASTTTLTSQVNTSLAANQKLSEELVACRGKCAALDEDLASCTFNIHQLQIRIANQENQIAQLITDRASVHQVTTELQAKYDHQLLVKVQDDEALKNTLEREASVHKQVAQLQEQVISVTSALVAASVAYSDKLKNRLQALEKVASSAHTHSLDYKCTQCASLKDAQVALTVVQERS